MIREFLGGKTILITGATGFLGQPLVEKILWVAPDIRRIYVLIRPKKQFGGRVLTAQERLEKELYGSSVFDRMQMLYRDRLQEFLRDRLIAVSGDISQEGLGLSGEDSSRLRDEVDIIINSAAVVSFDAPLNDALELNVFGALRLARFANNCCKAVLIHISTAYVCGAATGEVSETLHHNASDEQALENFPTRAFSDPDADIAEMQRIIASINELAGKPETRRKFTETMVRRSRKGRTRRRLRRSQEVEALRQRWLSSRLSEEGMRWARQRGWNDTYTYTKALGEQMVVRSRGRLPTAIIRPSVIESSLSEPSPGWLDGLRMADPLIVAIGKGRLRALPLNPEVVLDLVPADMVVNATLALMPTVKKSEEVRIVQVATSSENPINLGQLYELIYDYFRGNPMLDREGKPITLKRLRFPSPPSFRLQHRLKSVPLVTAAKTLERLPAFEATQKARRRLSATKAAHERLYYYGELYEPYLNLNCSFRVDEALSLSASLSQEEKNEFDFDVRRLNWRHYVQNVHIPGVKKHILKIEGAGTLELPEEQETDDFPGTIPNLLASSAATWPNRKILQFKGKAGWVKFTLAEVQDHAHNIARRLHSMGLKKGDRIVLFSENQPDWGISYLGAALLGLVVVPLDPQSWHREVWSVASYTEARAIVASERCLARLTEDELAENKKKKAPTLLLNANDGCRLFQDNGALGTGGSGIGQSTDFERPEIQPDDEASIIFTTGTAADPKGVVHTHRSFLNNLRGVDHYLSISEDDVLLSVLPLYHALEFTCGFLMPLYRGACVTYLHSLKPRVILETMRETKTTCMLGVPTLFALIRDDIERRILKTSKSTLKNNLMKTSKQLSRSVEQRFGKNIGRRLFAKVYEEFGGSVRVFVSGGSALGRRLYRDFRAMGIPIYEGYGLTETAPVLTVNPLHRSREGSVGKPLPGVEMRLFRPDRDGVGEIIVRTPSLMKEYYRNPAATKAVFRDGWFHTGDLGWVDADGYLYITGRCKDVIVTGAGKNVYPTDLEAIYRALPSIGEICVLGVKSGLTEDVHAVIVPDGSITPDRGASEVKNLIQKEIQELAKELPSYHRLQAIHLWSEKLPTEDGAVDRAAVRAWLQQLLAGQGRPPPPRTIPETSRRETLYAELSRLSGIEAEEIDEGTNLYTDLGLDSLMAVELLLFVERELGVNVSDERVAGFQTVGDVLDELKRRGSTENGFDSSTDRLLRSALPYEERPPVDRALLAASFASLKMLFREYFRLSVSNEGALPKEGPFIIAANHSSHLDSAAVISALSLAMGVKQAQKIHVIGARDYFFDSPFKSWIFSTCLNVVPIERDEIGLSGLRMVGSILGGGEPVLIFPEGTRSRTGELQEFKPGVGLIAWEYQVPVIPALIEGAYKAMPAGKAVPKRRPIAVRFGQPTEMAAYAQAAQEIPRDELYRRISNDLRRSVAALAKSD